MTNELHRKAASKPHFNIIKAALLSGLIFFFAYCGYWYWYSQKIQTTFQELTDQAALNGIIFDGDLQISGFPALHRAKITGSIMAPGLEIDIPEIRFTGISVPGSITQISAPQGILWRPIHRSTPTEKAASATVTEQKNQNEINRSALYQIDHFNIALSLPTYWPARWDQANLTKWQESNPQLSIYGIDIYKSPLTLSIQSILQLDKALQPSGEIVIKSTGHDVLAQELIDNNILGPREADIINTAFAGFSKPQDGSDKKTLHIALEIRNNGFYFGPLKIAPFPRINWPQ